MRRPDDALRLRHMRDAARKAVAYLHGVSRADFASDELRALAVTRLVELVGEAASGVSASKRESLPDIRWTAIVATRNRLIHGYFSVDLDIVWTIVNDDLPPLIVELEAALAGPDRA